MQEHATFTPAVLSTSGGMGKKFERLGRGERYRIKMCNHITIGRLLENYLLSVIVSSLKQLDVG